MAIRIAMLRSTGGKMANMLGIKRWTDSIPQAPALTGSIDHGVALTQLVLPENCGRVKLPHFFCCSGKRINSGEQNDSTS